VDYFVLCLKIKVLPVQFIKHMDGEDESEGGIKKNFAKEN